MRSFDWKKFAWLQADRLAAWTCIAVGALALFLGWRGVSGTPYPAEQLPYILSGGVAGIFLAGLGAMLLLSADLRDEWRKLDRIEQAIRGTQDPAGVAGTQAEANVNGDATGSKIEEPVVVVDQPNPGNRRRITRRARV